MQTNPLITVIVPIYNMEKYLSDCLEALIHQTYNNLEILLVNDGSTDASETIARSYAAKDSRIVVLCKENGGQSSARNFGLCRASGSYIGFVDSDDWISNDYYEHLLTALQKTEADIAYAEIHHMCGSDEKAFAIHEARLLTTFEDMVSYQNNGSVWSKLFRRSLLFDDDKLSHKFPEGLHWEDSEFLIKILSRAKSMVLVPKSVYYYRNTPTSIMNDKKNTDKNRQDRLIISQRIYDYFSQNKQLRPLIISYIINVVLDIPLLMTDMIYRSEVERVIPIQVEEVDNIQTKKLTIRFLNLIQFYKMVTKGQRQKFYLFGIQFLSKKIPSSQNNISQKMMG